MRMSGATLTLTFQLLEQESTEAESNSVDQQDLPTQMSTNQSQADSTSVSTEERLVDDEVVTNGPVAESPKETVVSTDETARVESPKEMVASTDETTRVESPKEMVASTDEITREEVPTEGPEVHIPNKSQSMEFNLEKILKTASKVTMDVNVDVFNTILPNSSERLGEYVEQGDFKAEELSEALVEPTATKARETPFTEVTQVKEDEVEMKLEIEDNHEKIQENELNRSWMQEAINLPEIFEIGLIRSNANDDSDDTLLWSPRVETLSLPESGAASGHDSEETIPWMPRVKTLERVARVESRIMSNKFHSLDEISQDESESEDVPPVNFPLKEAFVAMRSALKAVRKRKRRRKLKRKLIKGDKWHVNSEDKEWSQSGPRNHQQRSY